MEVEGPETRRTLRPQSGALALGCPPLCFTASAPRPPSTLYAFFTFLVSSSSAQEILCFLIYVTKVEVHVSI